MMTHDLCSIDACPQREWLTSRVPAAGPTTVKGKLSGLAAGKHGCERKSLEECSPLLYSQQQGLRISLVDVGGA
jgi:hypothetical protein